MKQEEQVRLQQEKEERQKENAAKMFQDQLQRTEQPGKEEPWVQEERQLQLELLRKMIAALNRMRHGSSGEAVQELLQNGPKPR